mmetsp:Transcript_63786/g.152105  ORF Transcript_63786/g.152105 Transcript_63786/m.152105 type:complete len:613 (+) Transcript_63786:71-1909(+)|eukprot:CAMPEP_0178415258 /NCGR_PEP_ID=MMETSP0689_2-20121128/23460_1 /TAXON_ID=160604 /ORGANISM="Amphidinium massartii, Strain CS-259" /LENGTH=612 /DNA_ID=CAMNT_0020036575 /DNA_START=17 /DNA_END=1855 /DNA_ORIENTATION=-
MVEQCGASASGQMPSVTLFSAAASVRKPARVDVPFPELPSDAHTEIPSWRTGLHSDWQLRLGPTVYTIHKVLTGHGPRASAFLCSAFTTGQQLNAAEDPCGACVSGETDLTHILPDQVWPYFDEVLDFVYSEVLSLTEENAVPLLRCADALQIRSLFLQCVDGINELLTVVTAPRILGDTVALLGGNLVEQISKAAQDVITEHFDSYEMSELERIPLPQLVQILKRDDLMVMHENEVFDRVMEITTGMEDHSRSEEEIRQLWQTVRFGAVSNSYLIKAAQVDLIPKMVLVWAKVLHRKCGSSMLTGPTAMKSVADGWPVEPPRPRKPFKDLVCAVMYSVDTDARNDQDVERNITAATLVAEEIEFLGGRAFLENIFARSSSSRSETGDASTIINMDQVDVAFVLAPWTPSEKRISRLIHFVDQGGGAVLLSFIGGLSKGMWLERQYEPLITGKVADNTPYEDVYLAASHGLETSTPSPLKRSQETLKPPRILCGVDSINGRRRITSKLVGGAKVLAKWSDGQPLVVRHPDKNVFSVSQRVSRIFELDDDLGHDDTLQLVLNVMVEAGKEARRIRGHPPASTSAGEPSGEGGAGAGDGLGNYFAGQGGVNVSL